MLHSIVHGEDTALPPLLIVPGLFGSARNWGVVARHLSARRKVIALDMRNHGDSFRSDDHSYPAMAGDLAEVIAAQGRACDVLGHSMGGKASMMLALTRPGLVNRLVVADIAPVSYGHAAYHKGLIHDMKALRIDDLTSRSEADRRLAETVKDPATRAFLLQSLELRDGPVRWKLNLDALEKNLPLILSWPALPEGTAFPGPVLFLYGTKSTYVTAEGRAAIAPLFPRAQYQGVDAGHWLHAERPREVETAVEDFLSHSTVG
ncbi:alpha/beta fold hydrolase [Paenirhodobacter sp.]|uniref:alpha/beta fold hydrolase n=1 Tax=Paenirhodobacter sp. TaxID=1965326 RepID=UPI003B3EA798